MDDDLNVSGALAVIFDAVRDGNTALDDGDSVRARELAGDVRRMLSVLGVDPLDAQWNSSGDSRATGALAALVDAVLAQRVEARAAKDYATADRLRDQLAAAGVVVEDTPDGARWSLAGRTDGD